MYLRSTAFDKLDHLDFIYHALDRQAEVVGRVQIIPLIKEPSDPLQKRNEGSYD